MEMRMDSGWDSAAQIPLAGAATPTREPFHRVSFSRFSSLLFTLLRAEMSCACSRSCYLSFC
ncbi:hypothetical protein J3E69DRAFT_329474 [Trichoderma sp. SZMC 28015]